MTAQPRGRVWVRERLCPPPRAVPDAAAAARGDHDLNPGWQIPGPLTPAAVLVLLVERERGPTILLTRRAAHLRHHPRQVSFPGGRLDPSDRDPVACALRETHEEVGLRPDRVEVLGGLDVYVVRTGFAVAPVVGAAAPPLGLAPRAGEVAGVLEVPLEVVLDPGRYQIDTVDHDGEPRRFYALEHGPAWIWGATAGMLNNLREALTGEPAPGDSEK